MNSVSSISSSTLASVDTTTANANAFQQALQNLGNSLDSGNLSAAQTAFDQLQESGKSGGHHHHHHHAQTGETTQNSPANSNSSLATATLALGSALKSGNLPAARSALAILQQSLESSRNSADSSNNISSSTATQDISAGSTFSVQA